MGTQISGNYDENQIEAFEQMQEEGKADSYAEAARMSSNVGLQHMGYINGQNRHTALKGFVTRAAWLLTVAGLVGLAFTFAYPVPARIPSFAVLVVGVVLFPIREWLESREPDVSNKLKALVGGEKA
jgi:hypothetical protein